MFETRGSYTVWKALKPGDVIYRKNLGGLLMVIGLCHHRNELGTNAVISVLDCRCRVRFFGFQAAQGELEKKFNPVFEIQSHQINDIYYF